MTVLFLPKSKQFRINVVHKTQRWALRLSEFNFTVGRIPGEHNVWAEMLKRWAAPANEESCARRASSFRVPLITEEKPDLPSVEVIAKSQEKCPPKSDQNFPYKLLETLRYGKINEENATSQTNI